MACRILNVCFSLFGAAGLFTGHPGSMFLFLRFSCLVVELSVLVIICCSGGKSLLLLVYKAAIFRSSLLLKSLLVDSSLLLMSSLLWMGVLLGIGGITARVSELSSPGLYSRELCCSFLGFGTSWLDRSAAFLRVFELFPQNFVFGWHRFLLQAAFVV
ncbi:hypothetical protein U1Q18_021649 [Sarracenia purpurea var. burkii]